MSYYLLRAAHVNLHPGLLWWKEY